MKNIEHFDIQLKHNTKLVKTSKRGSRTPPNQQNEMTKKKMNFKVDFAFDSGRQPKYLK